MKRSMALAMVCACLLMAVGDATGGGGIDVLIVPSIRSVRHPAGFFSVKFLCGTIEAGSKTAPLAPGLYRTVINIQNLGSETDVLLYVDARFDRSQRLATGARWSVDCELMARSVPPGDFFEVFVGVSASRSVKDTLNVVAVYTKGD